MLVSQTRMTVGRRQLFQFLALAGGCGATADAAEPAISLEVLRAVSLVHGTGLSEERLRVLQPVLEHSLPQLRALRDFEIDDAVAPAFVNHG